MRKRIATRAEDTNAEILDLRHLPIEAIAEVEVTSEHPDCPIESALSGLGTTGWRAATPGEQRVTVLFDAPEMVGGMTLQFVEAQTAPTQEFVPTWSSQIRGIAHTIVRQQWTFSPTSSTTESEAHFVNLSDVRVLELRIKPDLSDPAAIARLREWRIYRNESTIGAVSRSGGE